jgi:hypothetical protein
VPISAVDCVQPALQHTRDQLFRPFRFGQWSRLAFVGLLAAELHTSGCNFTGFNVPLQHPRGGGREFLATPFPHIDPARIAQFAGLIAAVIALAIVVGLIFIYLNSIFRFILFDSVLKKRCSISAGWARWQRPGRRYFLWQLVLMIAQGLFLGVLIGIPLALAAMMGWFKDVQQHIARTVLGVFLLIILFLVFALVAAAVQLLAKDFLVPIMALEDLDFADAWSRLLALIRPEPGKYVIYLLLKIVLAIAAAIVFGLVSLIPILLLVAPAVLAVFASYKAGLTWNVTTVSLAIIFGSMLMVVLAYLIALVAVPATVFFPAFSIYFFASRYPQLGALLYPSPPPVPVAPPVAEAPPQAAPSEGPPPEPPPLPPTPEPIS